MYINKYKHIHNNKARTVGHVVVLRILVVRVAVAAAGPVFVCWMVYGGGLVGWMGRVGCCVRRVYVCIHINIHTYAPPTAPPRHDVGLDGADVGGGVDLVVLQEGLVHARALVCF
jgi:hypothetical protein